MDPKSKILKFPPAEDLSPASDQERSFDRTGVEPQAQTSMTAVLAPPEKTAAEQPPPVWMQRFFLVTTVIFCLWVGFVLAVLPWQPAWTENGLLINSPNLRWFLGTGFVRGMATGLGILDLWIGISEAVHYRDRR